MGNNRITNNIKANKKNNYQTRILLNNFNNSKEINSKINNFKLISIIKILTFKDNLNKTNNINRIHSLIYFRILNNRKWIKNIMMMNLLKIKKNKSKSNRRLIMILNKIYNCLYNV